MLNECRCGQCNRLLARVGEYTELQIKCSRCGTLNHVRA
ncbi:Com family DNA-binding transcriptional regulator, partial [Pseudomonas viridiflava]